MKCISFSSLLLDYPALEIRKYNPVLWFYVLLGAYEENETHYSFEIDWEDGGYWEEKKWKLLEKDFTELGYPIQIQHENTQSFVRLECDNFIQDRIQAWIEKRCSMLKIDRSLENIQEYMTYLLYELQDKNPKAEYIGLQRKDFEGCDVRYDDKSVYFGENDIIETEKYFHDIILLSLYVLGVISEIYFPVEMIEKIPGVPNNYGVVINTAFRYDSLLDKIILQEELSKIDKDVQSVCLRKTRKGHMLEKTRLIYGLDKRIVDLLKTFPHATISAEVYNGKINKYKIVEKILIKDLEK